MNEHFIIFIRRQGALNAHTTFIAQLKKIQQIKNNKKRKEKTSGWNFTCNILWECFEVVAIWFRQLRLCHRQTFRDWNAHKLLFVRRRPPSPTCSQSRGVKSVSVYFILVPLVLRVSVHVRSFFWGGGGVLMFAQSLNQVGEGRWSMLRICTEHVWISAEFRLLIPQNTSRLFPQKKLRF